MEALLWQMKSIIWRMMTGIPAVAVDTISIKMGKINVAWGKIVQILTRRINALIVGKQKTASLFWAGQIIYLMEG
jgi:hypothetical protein